MKILMLTWEYPPRIVGGIARVVHDLSKRLIKDGHEVTVVTYKDGDLPEYENDKGVKVYRVERVFVNKKSVSYLLRGKKYRVQEQFLYKTYADAERAMREKE